MDQALEKLATVTLEHLKSYVKRCTPENPPNPQVLAEMRRLIEMVSNQKTPVWFERLQALEKRVADMTSRDSWKALAGGDS